MSLIFRKPQQLTSGQALGPFVAGEALGEGGMGLVYKARDTRTGREVALKLLRQRFNTGHREALVEEARVAAKLSSPHCVKLLDAFAFGPEQQPVLVYEYVAGCDLRSLLESELVQRQDVPGLSPLAACLIMEQCLKGVRAAHRAQFIHQDLKPENFLVEDWVLDKIDSYAEAEGHVRSQVLEYLLFELRDEAWIKLADWGMALIREDAGDFSQSLSMSISQIPDSKRGGTLVYMPPEQIDGSGVSRRSDVFALGLIFYELLTGKTAQDARLHSEELSKADLENLQVFLVKLLNSDSFAAIDLERDSALSRFRKTPAIRALLEGMTARVKRERMDSEAVEDELRRLIEDSPHELHGPSSSEYWPVLALVSSLLLAALTGVFIKGQRASKPPEPDQPKTVVKDPAAKPTRVARTESGTAAGDIDKPVWLDTLARGDLTAFEAITELDLELVEAILKAHKKGRKTELKLHRVKTLSGPCLKALLKSPMNELSLPSLTQLPTESIAPELFSKLKSLSLPALETLEPHHETALKCLKVQSLTLGVKALTGRQFLLLLRASRSHLSLPRLEYLPTDLELEELADSGVRELYLDGLIYPKAELFKEFSKRLALQVLSLAHVRSLTLKQAQALASFDRAQLKLGGVERLDPATAKALVQGSLQSYELESLKTLSHETAKALQTKNGLAITLGLERLDAAVAHAMASWTFQRIRLPRLQVLSEKSANYLSYYSRGTLALGITTLTLPAFEALAQFRASTLTLSELEVLPSEWLPVLKKYPEKRWYFPKLKVQSPEQSKLLFSLKFAFFPLRFNPIDEPSLKLLAKRTWPPELKFLTATRFASDFACEPLNFKANVLIFEALEDLTPEAARSLSEFKGLRLVFPKLRHLSEATAEVLSRCPANTIELTGLESMAAGAPEQLARFRCQYLILGGAALNEAQNVRGLRAFEKFIEYRTESLSEALKEEIQATKAQLVDVSAFNLSESDLEALLRARTELRLSKLRTLSASQAKAVLSAECAYVTFGDLSDIGPEALKVLVSNRTQNLAYQGLADWTVSQCQLLAQSRATNFTLMSCQAIPDRNLQALKELSCANLYLNFQRTVPASKVKLLTQTKSQFTTFSNVSVLHVAVAKALKTSPNGVASFPALKSTSVDALMALQNFKGFGLTLGLLEIKLEWLRELRKCPVKYLYFSRLETLTEEQALALAEFQTPVLGFQKLRDCSKPAWLALAKFKQELTVDCPSIPKDMIPLINNFTGESLSFYGLTRLSIADAQIINQCPAKLVKLTEVTEASDEALKELAKLKGLVSMSSAMIKRIKKYRGDRGSEKSK